MAEEHEALQLIGAKIGHYKILHEIARGSMGIVFYGEHEELHRPVAIKMLPHSLTTDIKFVKRFYQEAEAASKLRHPNIATVFDLLEGYDTHFYVMDYIDGSTLEKKLADEGFTIKQAVQIISQILEGLQYAHQHGVIHRDMKPANIMINSDGMAIITDFGLAKIENATVLTVDGTILGTPAYMSPEQIRAEYDEIDQRTDIYSTGVILYEILTERAPFAGHSHMATMKKVLEDTPVSPRKINKNISKDLETIILKAMDKEVSRRYTTIQEFLNDIHRLQNNEAILASPPSIFYRLKKQTYKHRKILIPSLSILLISGGVLLWKEYYFQTQSQANKKILDRALSDINKSQQQNQILLDQLSEDPLFRVLDDPDPFIRSNALIALNKKVRGTQIQGTLAEKALNITQHALADPNIDVRKNAAILLGLLHDTRNINILLQQLPNEEDIETKINIILALGWLEDKKAVPALLKELKHDQPKIRAHTLLALGLIRSMDSFELIIQALSDIAPEVRSNAILCLTEFKNPKAITYILPLLKDTAPLVQESAQKSIQQFGEMARLPMIQFILKDSTTSEADIVKAIENIQIETDLDVLPYLQQHFQDDSEKIRILAVITTGLFGQKESIPYLITALTDSALEVRENAHLALVGITQQNFGLDPIIWQKWYDQQKPHSIANSEVNK